LEQIRTYSDERLDYYCAFCGSSPNTRDHIPSKILLDKPFPENLPVVPACRKCNQSFSKDEEYLACLIECAIHGTTEPSGLSRNKIATILSKKKPLKVRLEHAIVKKDNQIYFQTEENRVRNVILKLAQGHSRHENSESQFDEPVLLWFRPLTTMSDKEKEEFFSNEELTLLPEIGSRAFQRTMFDEQGVPRAYWKVVQPNNYSYSICHISNGLRVRIVIWEYLACEVIWDY
jgi:hypothetical protein